MRGLRAAFASQTEAPFVDDGHGYSASIVAPSFVPTKRKRYYKMSMEPHRKDLTCFYSALESDDTWIEIVPSFSYGKTLPLISLKRSNAYKTSKQTVGPFKAGIPTQAPLWLALLWHPKSLCTISVPEWLSVDNLTHIIAYERSEGSLWTNRTQKGQRERNDINDDAENNQSENTSGDFFLPVSYYEIAQRLLSTNNKSIEDHVRSSLLLLIEDLLDIRMDKLRQQFQNLLAENGVGRAATDDAAAMDLLVSVNGIGTREVALLKAFVIQALNDQKYLSTNETDAGKQQEADTDVKGEDRRAATAVRSRVPIRQFRK